MQIHGNAIGRGGIDDTSHDQTIKQSSNVNKFASQDGLEAHQRSTSSPNTGNDKPTDGASDTNKSNPDPNADLPYVIEDRLKTDPAFLEAQAALAEVSTLEADFTLVDRHTGAAADKRIEYGNLVALVNDKGADAAARAAAQRLLDNASLWNAISKDDQWVGIHDVKALIQERKNAVNTAREAVANQARAERGVPTATTGASNDAATMNPGAGTTTPDGTTPADGTSPTDATTPKPPPSTKPGVEGALENLANGQDWIQKELERLANEAAADPSKATALQAKMTMLQNQYQALANMTTQLSQMLSNLTKMWSDIAMNSVRNIK